MVLSYIDVRAVVKDVLKEAANEAEIATLRARVAELEAQIAGAVEMTDAVEQAAQAGLPT